MCRRLESITSEEPADHGHGNTELTDPIAFLSFFLVFL